MRFVNFTDEQWTFVVQCLSECLEYIGLHENEDLYNPDNSPEHVVAFFQSGYFGGCCCTQSSTFQSEIFYNFDDVGLSMSLNHDGIRPITELDIWKEIAFVVGHERRHEWQYLNVPNILSWTHEEKEDDADEAGFQFANIICKEKFGVEVY